MKRRFLYFKKIEVVQMVYPEIERVKNNYNLKELPLK